MNHLPLHVVVRSSGERTAAKIEQLLQDNGHKVSHVCGTPFERTLEQAYRAGSEFECDWVIMVDGDVIPSLNGLIELRTTAAAYDDDVLGSSAYTLDRYLGCLRYVGVRIFRRELLSELIPLIPEPGTQIRPETFGHRLLEQKTKWRHIKSQVPCGLHGYEQYFRDIVATNFTLARKPEFETALAKKLLSEESSCNEMRIASLGMAMSRAAGVDARIDRSQLSDLTDAIFKRLEITEKAELLQIPSQVEIDRQLVVASQNQLVVPRMTIYQRTRHAVARVAKSMIRG